MMRHIGFSYFSIFLVFLTLSTTNLLGQTKTLITYKVKVVENDKNIVADKMAKDISAKFNSAIEESDYQLIVDDTTAIFRVKETMDTDYDENKIRKAKIIAGGIRYRHLKDSLNIQQKSFLGKQFNIVHPYSIYDWTITKEKKVISGFTCYKAIASKKVRSIINNNENLVSFSVWFTPEIPLPFGPAGIDGLPGLVLFASINSSGSTYFYADKIEYNKNLDTKDSIDLDKGEYIKHEDYSKLAMEKFLEIKNKS